MHGGTILAYAQQANLPLNDLVDCSANINPLGPPASVWQAIAQALPAIVHYPDASHRAVTEVIARRFGVDEASILCGNGAMEALELVMRQVRPTRVVILQPAFGEYEAIARRSGYEVVSVPLHYSGDGYQLPWSVLHQTLRSGDLLIINNPHNPTGRVWPKETVHDPVRALCQQGVTVLLDESFVEFVTTDEYVSAMGEVSRLRHLYVVRSATKIFAIPGLRFGFVVGHPEAIQRAAQDRDGWSVNTLAQAAAIAAYQDVAFLQQTRDWLRAEHKYIAATWGSDGRLFVEPMGVNFFLVRFSDGAAAVRVSAALQQEGIFLRDCSSFSGLDGRFRRIAIKTRAQNEKVWARVRCLL